MGSEGGGPGGFGRSVESREWGVQGQERDSRGDWGEGRCDGGGVGQWVGGPWLAREPAKARNETHPAHTF